MIELWKFFTNGGTAAIISGILGLIGTLLIYAGVIEYVTWRASKKFETALERALSKYFTSLDSQEQSGKKEKHE
ncbi:hypothetical protein HY967_04750 [Candidatus Jorgensenbacteria bacterium]|nr:hypothetical protein [Candidatus Jorgensenbacteria bacterium]